MTVVPLRPERTANEVSRLILDAAMKVHSALGPGLLESTYEACLAQELNRLAVSLCETFVPFVVSF